MLRGIPSQATRSHQMTRLNKHCVDSFVPGIYTFLIFFCRNHPSNCHKNPMLQNVSIYAWILKVEVGYYDRQRSFNRRQPCQDQAVSWTIHFNSSLYCNEVSSVRCTFAQWWRHKSNTVCECSQCFLMRHAKVNFTLMRFFHIFRCYNQKIQYILLELC